MFVDIWGKGNLEVKGPCQGYCQKNKSIVRREVPLGRCHGVVFLCLSAPRAMVAEIEDERASVLGSMAKVSWFSGAAELVRRAFSSDYCVNCRPTWLGAPSGELRDS